MCTVSFLPVGNNTIMITSNRDDHPSRATNHIETITIRNKKVMFPQDPKSKGTWIAMSNSGQIAVLLNGAYSKHLVNPPYAQSRGTMFLQFFDFKSVDDFVENHDFIGMEPFTMLIYEDMQLHELIWDEKELNHQLYDDSLPHIWASCTLYGDEVKWSRNDHYTKWYKNMESLESNGILFNDIMEFHEHTEPEDMQNGFVINREERVKTLSITNIVSSSNMLKMTHKDLIGNKVVSTQMVLN